MDYSVLLSIYKNTKLEELDECLESVVCQLPKPKEIVIVIDGYINDELSQYINNLKEDIIYKIVPLDTNLGLGNALREGTKYCTCEWIMRIDSDDICVPGRVVKQVAYLEKHPDIDVLGGDIAEFIGNKENIISYRKVPSKHNDICEYLKSRCPLNHMTVFIRKTKLEESGGYLDWHYNEDSYLWVRMYLAGAKFANIPENLVWVRVDEQTFKRRGGYKYYKSERDLFRFMYKNGIINWFELQKAKFIRIVVQILMPNSVRQWFFKKFARS